ncbi:MAG: sulfurtransferase [bacterium]|nr:sulfurtransferase [bacterium]
MSVYTTLISADDLSGNLYQPGWVIVDCRFSLADRDQGKRDYEEAHIPEAVYAHLDNTLASAVEPGKTGRHPLPAVGVLAELFSKWGIDKDTQVVVYDDNIGAIASRLWWMLRWLGHEKVAVLDGGWGQWVKEELLTTGVVQGPQAAPFAPEIQPHLLVEMEHLKKNMSEPACLVVDSRAGERYRGEEEPIDSIPGHIPGAVNRPFKENAGEDGFMRSPDELKDRFESLLGDADPGQTVFYCGSGVTACHNLLAMKHAGLGDGKLYAGSWSEWITQKDPPIETGGG